MKRPLTPVPMYGLDRLAARPEATVLLVEGEKTADAAELLFPGCVAITSQGGSNGAAGAVVVTFVADHFVRPAPTGAHWQAARSRSGRTEIHQA